MMSDTSKQNDQSKYARIFASTANNRGWDLVEAQKRSAEDDRAMLDAAHAACWHWSQVGSDTQRAWAELLVAAVHAQLGLGDTALAYAAGGWAVVSGDDPALWERALGQIILAQAQHAAGKIAAYEATRAAALADFENLPEGPDRAIVARSLANLPSPGAATT